MDWAEENSLKIIREAISNQAEEFSVDTDWGALEKELNNQALLPLDLSSSIFPLGTEYWKYRTA